MQGVENSGNEKLRSSWALDHAWRYFELHAQQRMSVFNFYVVFSGLALAGLAATLQGSSRFSALGIALGLIIALLSFVFWKLDERSAMLIKHSEGVIENLESIAVGDAGAVFTKEAATSMRLTKSGVWVGIWTFGRCFRLVFGVMGALGLASSVLAGLRFYEVIEWAPVEKSSATHAAVQASVPSTVQPAASSRATDLGKTERSLD